jgi:hypothetical protein
MNDLQQGEKYLSKRSFFGKSSPDLDGALTCFDSASSQFKAQKDWDNAVKALILSSETNQRLQQIFSAGDKLSSAAHLVSLHLNNPERASSLYLQASNFFVAHGILLLLTHTTGSTERAAEMLEKAAKHTSNFEVKYYFDAVDIYENVCIPLLLTSWKDDRLRSSVDCFTRGISLFISRDQLLKAAQLTSRLITVLGKVCVPLSEK